MEQEILILNAMDYIDKNTKKEKGRLSFIFTSKDNFQDKEKFVGFPEVAVFYDHFIKDLIPVVAIGKPLKAKIQTRPSLRNPMKSFSVIESFTLENGKSINLLQS